MGLPRRWPLLKRLMVALRKRNVVLLFVAACAGMVLSRCWVAVLARLGDGRPIYHFSSGAMIAFAGRALAVLLGLALAHWWLAHSPTVMQRPRLRLDWIGVLLVRAGLALATVGVASLLSTAPSTPGSSALAMLATAGLNWRLCPAMVLALCGLNAPAALTAGWQWSGERPWAAAGLAVVEWLPAGLAAISRDALVQPGHLVLPPWSAWDPGASVAAVSPSTGAVIGLLFASWLLAASHLAPTLLPDASGPIREGGLAFKSPRPMRNP